MSDCIIAEERLEGEGARRLDVAWSTSHPELKSSPSHPLLSYSRYVITLIKHPCSGNKVITRMRPRSADIICTLLCVNTVFPERITSSLVGKLRHETGARKALRTLRAQVGGETPGD